MTYFPRFVFPWALLLLALVPWSVYVGMKIRSLTPARKWTAIALRGAIVTCLVAALAGLELVKRSDRLAVFYLLDHSNSIPESLRLATAQAVREAARTYMTGRDEAGVIVFGEEASIELRVGPALDLGEILSYVGGEQTDLAGAIRLATAAFPQGYMKRIVVLSDGNETRGSALEETKLAQAAGIVTDVVPMGAGTENELRVREVSAPGRVNAGEPFQTRVVVTSEQDCSGTLRLFQRTAEGRRLLAEQEVTMQKGDNAFLLPQELASAGFYEYVATIDSLLDTLHENNEGHAFTIVQGTPRVLYVESNPQQSVTLGPALVAEGLDVTTISLGEMPVNLSQLQNYDAVALSNVSSTDLSTDQLRALEAMVRDLGIGLVMIGGPDSFGAGGYQNTPVERALPVSMDVKQRKMLPRGALALILHTCEIPDGNAWSRDIGIAALEVLSSQDLMGALAYGMGGEDWLFELQPVDDKSKMRRLLSRAMPGDMPDVGTTLSKAYVALRDADAAVKRVVIISDGDPAAPTPALLKSLSDAKISVSTVCIAPHGPNDQNMLRWVASQTGGNYYFVTNAKRLPQIFTKEAAVVKRGLLIEKPFMPLVGTQSEVLTGLLELGFPELRGYVVTTAKDAATIPLLSPESDPILAHWRYGLGKSVAFTSDVTSRWAPAWLQWPGFNRFWAQSVRWAMREVQDTSFRVETRVREGMGYVRIDAVDAAGKFINFLRPRGVVTGPGPEFERQDLSLLQTAPGIYEGTFPLNHRGVYMVNLLYDRGDGSQGMLPTGLAMGYSREYEYSTPNVGLLEQLAAAGGGKMRDPGDNPFDHNLEPSATLTPLWMYLAALAACLFPIEIFVRRVTVDWGAIVAGAAWVLRLLRPLRRWIPEPKRRTGPATGAYRGGASVEMTFAPVPGERTDDDLSREKAPLTPSEPGAAVEAVTPVKKPEGKTEYTRKLLEAKERALKKRGRGGDEDGK